MSHSYSNITYEEKQRRSKWVTIGIVAALVVGVPVMLTQCGDDEDPVVPGQAYSNNYYVPGAGYYHAGFNSFFPYRYNHFESGRGYYYGGGWHGTADTARNVTSSVPAHDAVAKANTSYRATAPSTRGGFGRTGGVFSSRS